MKETVARLVALVSGSSGNKTSGYFPEAIEPTEKNRRRLRSPQMRTVPRRMAAAQKEETNPQHIIPLDDDDFRDF